MGGVLWKLTAGEAGDEGEGADEESELVSESMVVRVITWKGLKRV